METKDLTPTTRQEIESLFAAEGVKPTDRLLAEIEDWAEGYHAPCDLELFQQEREKQERRRRERFEAAVAAMQEVMRINYTEDHGLEVKEVVSDAVLYADALLARLYGEVSDG